MDGRWAAPSQYVPQYLLFFAAEQLQPGCAHFLVGFSAMTSSSSLIRSTMKLAAQPAKSETLGDHFKTGHRGSLQNRPMELSQDKLIYTLSDRSLAMDFHSRKESNIY